MERLMTKMSFKEEMKKLYAVLIRLTDEIEALRLVWQQAFDRGIRDDRKTKK